MFCRLHGNCFVAPIEVTSAAVALPFYLVTSTYYTYGKGKARGEYELNAGTPNRGCFVLLSHSHWLRK